MRPELVQAIRRRRLFEQHGSVLRVLPVGASLTAAVVLYPLGDDATYGFDFVLAVGMAAATVVAIQAVPWRKLGAAAQITPLLSFLAAVALLRDAQGGASSGYSPMMFVPIVWAAVFGGPLVLAAMVGFATLSLALPAAIAGAPDYPAGEYRRAVLLAVSAALAGWIVNWLTAVLVAEFDRREQAERALLRLRADEIHDDIVQALAAASLSFTLDDRASAERGIARALRRAQDVVANLISDQDVRPGGLRRTAPPPA